jgi:hypothetical protein
VSLLVMLPPIVVVLHFIAALLLRKIQPGKRLLMALLLIALAYPLQFLGVIVGLGADPGLNWLARLCLFAPPLMAILSFIVYVPLLTSNSHASTTETAATE